MPRSFRTGPRNRSRRLQSTSFARDRQRLLASRSRPEGHEDEHLDAPFVQLRERFFFAPGDLESVVVDREGVTKLQPPSSDPIPYRFISR
ncbi:hypothetical protein [Sorangium sp. So ce131]|uniref:hypothetical protein n=1 Tax=Sorangium sp. So ce131 TaxID=3133282 RepID=UPI003F612999